LSFENICLATQVTAHNHDRVYGLVVTSCNGVLLSNCILYAEILGTNTHFDSLVAINDAANVHMLGGAMVCNDATDANRIFMASTHGAKPARFERVLFAGRGVDRVANGDARFVDCLIVGTPDREYEGLQELPDDLLLPAAIERARAVCAGIPE
jgi:hypothetical protein